MTYLKRLKTLLIPTESLPSLVKKLSRVSKDLGVMATQTDTMASIGVTTLGRQKTTVASPSTRRRGGGGESCSKEPELNHDQNVEVKDRELQSCWQA